MGCTKAIVFDLDGTLVDSAPDLLVAINKLLQEQSRPGLTLEEMTPMIGDGAAKLVERAFAASGGTEDVDLDVSTTRFLHFYEGHASINTRPYPHVPEVLKMLRGAGYVLGVCTNKPERATREVLRDLELTQHFTAVIGGDTVEGVRKPDPRALLAVLAQLGAVAEHAVMVGDNANDVSAARAAGLRVIVRAGGYTATPAHDLGADAVFADFEELPSLVAHVSRRLAESQGG